MMQWWMNCGNVICRPNIDDYYVLYGY